MADAMTIMDDYQKKGMLSGSFPVDTTQPRQRDTQQPCPSAGPVVSGIGHLLPFRL